MEQWAAGPSGLVCRGSFVASWLSVLCEPRVSFAFQFVYLAQVQRAAVNYELASSGDLLVSSALSMFMKRRNYASVVCVTAEGNEIAN